MNTARALTWVSRALFAVGLVLFAGLFGFMATRPTSGEVTTSGSTVINMSSGELHVVVFIFVGIAWSWLAGAGMRTVAQGTSWPRVMLSIVASRVIALVAFGAKGAVASIDGEVARVKDMYHQAQQRNVERTAPPPYTPQAFTPSVQTFIPLAQSFMPEPPAQEPPPLAR